MKPKGEVFTVMSIHSTKWVLNICFSGYTSKWTVYQSPGGKQISLRWFRWKAFNQGIFLNGHSKIKGTNKSNWDTGTRNNRKPYLSRPDGATGKKWCYCSSVWAELWRRGLSASRWHTTARDVREEVEDPQSFFSFRLVSGYFDTFSFTTHALSSELAACFH